MYFEYVVWIAWMHLAYAVALVPNPKITFEGYRFVLQPVQRRNALGKLGVWQLGNDPPFRFFSEWGAYRALTIRKVDVFQQYPDMDLSVIAAAFY